MKMEELETTLATLRKHGVTEYSQDQFGIRVKFDPQVATNGEGLTTLAEIHTLAQGMRSPEPEPSTTEPQQLDIEAALFGAK